VLKGCDQEQVNKILNDIDENGDEKISREEFIAYIKEERFL
jgi:Ca2+-binding EF-hand superfamily protein